MTDLDLKTTDSDVKATDMPKVAKTSDVDLKTSVMDLKTAVMDLKATIMVLKEAHVAEVPQAAEIDVAEAAEASPPTKRRSLVINHSGYGHHGYYRYHHGYYPYFPFMWGYPWFWLLY